MRKVIKYSNFIKTANSMMENLHPKLSQLARLFNHTIVDNHIVIKGHKIEYFDETDTYHVDGTQYNSPKDVIRHIDTK